MNSMHQGLDIFELRAGGYAVAQVENVTVQAPHVLEYSSRRIANSLRVGGQQEWIEIALHADSGRQALPDLRESDVPIHAEHLRSATGQFTPVSMCALRKHDHGHLALNRPHDPLHPFPGRRPEIHIREIPGVTV